MPLDSKHPQYADALPAWLQLRDCYAGEIAIKQAGLTYLPATPGQLIDGMLTDQRGYQNYQAYKKRAVFPSFVSDAVKAMVGVMHHKPPIIELPPVLEPLKEVATADGESLALLLRRINEAQLTTGRIGLLLDLPEGERTEVQFSIATYEAEKAINWDTDLVVLDETEAERNADFEWLDVKKYRVLSLDGGTYSQAQFRNTLTYDANALRPPTVRGKTLTELPFVFINATDCLWDVSAPPQLELANLCLTIYRGEADYRQNLFMQAQDTLVVIGEEEPPPGEAAPPTRVGAGAKISIPSGAGNDAKFIGVSSNGLPEQRQALENDRRRAAMMGAQLLDTTSRQKESGEALQVRVAAQTATLNQIALAGAFGLQSLLRIAATWVGADPALVNVKPNLDFADAGMTPADFLQLAQAKVAGFPISDESMHALAVENEYTVKDYKEEIKLIDAEKQKAMAMMPQLTLQPIQQPPDDRQQPPNA